MYSILAFSQTYLSYTQVKSRYEKKHTRFSPEKDNADSVVYPFEIYPLFTSSLINP